MKPKNNKAVVKAYARFTLYLFLTIIVAVSVFWLFFQTSSVEIARIQVQTASYDVVYKETIDIVNSFDSTYNYIGYLDEPMFDHTNLINKISKRKVGLQKRMSSMDKDDCSIYNKLNQNIEQILAIKDSIRQMSQKEEMIRDELTNSLEENRKVIRKATLRGIR